MARFLIVTPGLWVVGTDHTMFVGCGAGRSFSKEAAATPGLSLRCAASEGTPFVARRAVNLHGCALPHFAPLLRRLRRALRA